MYLDFRHRIRCEIFDEIFSQDFQKTYRQLQQRISPLNVFGSSHELIEFMHKKKGNRALKDSILLGLIKEIRSDTKEKPRILLLLLAILWPGMDHLNQILKFYFPHSENLFADIYWQYIEFIFDWDLEKKNSIAGNLQLNTRKRVTQVRKSPSEIIAFKPIKSKQPIPEDIEEMLGVLDELEKTNVITEEESLLIRGHALYGTKLLDLAQTRGIKYKTFCRRYERLVHKVFREIRKK